MKWQYPCPAFSVRREQIAGNKEGRGKFVQKMRKNAGTGAGRDRKLKNLSMRGEPRGLMSVRVEKYKYKVIVEELGTQLSRKPAACRDTYPFVRIMRILYSTLHYWSTEN
jgi:hypothetical protein